MKNKRSSLKITFFLILNIFNIFVSNTWALETDQYMTFGIKLKDSSVHINELVNNQMKYAVLKLSPKSSCLKATHDVLSWVGGQYGETMGLTEKHVLENTEIDIFPSRDKLKSDYINNSIYAKSFLLKTFPLAPTININGVYIGSDKIGHFFSVGRYYYRVYLRSKMLGFSNWDAIMKSYKAGLFSEKTYYGLWASGVYSYADLQANYEGFHWALSFCEGPRPMLFKKDGVWHWNGNFQIQDYVSPLWDETFNTNSYSKSRGREVFKQLSKRCLKTDPAHIAERFSYYSNNFEHLLARDFRKIVIKMSMPSQIERNFCELE